MSSQYFLLLATYRRPIVEERWNVKGIIHMLNMQVVMLIAPLVLAEFLFTYSHFMFSFE